MTTIQDCTDDLDRMSVTAQKNEPCPKAIAGDALPARVDPTYLTR